MPAEIQGADRLVSTLDQAAEDIQDLAEGHHAAGQVLATAGQASAPRLTGALAATVTYQVGHGLVSLTAGSSSVRYAAAVHARHPWLTRTVHAKQDEVVDAYLEATEQVLSQVQGT